MPFFYVLKQKLINVVPFSDRKKLGKRWRTWRRIFITIQSAKNRIPQIHFKITELPQEKLSNTAILKNPNVPLLITNLSKSMSNFVSTDEHCIKLVQQGVHVQLLQLLARTIKKEVNTPYIIYGDIFWRLYLECDCKIISLTELVNL